MGTLTSKLRRERTNAAHKVAMQTFNAPSTYPVPYGKLHQLVSGRGPSGNPSTQGPAVGTNPVTPGTYIGTNPTAPGTYAGSNPPTGGYYAGTNPPTGGYYAGMNSVTPGNYAGTVPGNAPYSGTYAPNSQVIGYNTFSQFGQYYQTPYSNTGPNTSYVQYAVENGGSPAPTYYASSGNEGMGGDATYTEYLGTNPGNPNYYTTPGTPYYVPGNAPYDYYNPPQQPTPYYNPTVPGNAYYNPPVPGNAYYNAPIPGNANYNPPTPGNTIYGAPVPGNAAPPVSVFGVMFPGGAAGQLAPLVPDTMVTIPYQTSGVAVSTPPGGYVTIKEL